MTVYRICPNNLATSLIISTRLLQVVPYLLTTWDKQWEDNLLTASWQTLLRDMRFSVCTWYTVFWAPVSCQYSITNPSFGPNYSKKKHFKEISIFARRLFQPAPMSATFYIYFQYVFSISSPDKKEITIGKTKVLTAVIELSNHDEISYNPEVVITHDSSLQYEKITVLDVSIFKIFSNIAENNV
jgi:hypothetical protein